MKTQSYQERVQSLAERMARDFFGELYEGFPESEKQSDINDFIGSARIAVAEMAQAVGKAILELQDEADKYTIRGYCLAHGLIPDAQEAKCPNCNSTNSEKMVRDGFCVCKDCRSVFKCNSGKEAEGYAG